MVRQLIAAGQGVSFVPAVTWKGLGGGRVVLRPLRYPKGKRYLYLSAYERAYLSHAVKAFRDYALSYFVRLAEEAAAEPRA
jgi:DNA-binding transcriptional LysR family regulator